MIVDILKRLYLSGELNQLIFAEICKDKVLRKMEVYFFFNKEMLITRDKPTAITSTAEQLDVSESYVYKAIQLMESEEIKIPKADDKSFF